MNRKSSNEDYNGIFNGNHTEDYAKDYLKDYGEDHAGDYNRGYREDHAVDFADDYDKSYGDGYIDDYGDEYSDGYSDDYGNGDDDDYDDRFMKLADFLNLEIDGDIDVELIKPIKENDGMTDGEAGSADGDAEADAQSKSKAKMELYDWVQCIVSAIIVGIFIFVFVGRTIGVDGISMMDTLHNYDRVIMSSFFYTPNNGDIIVFQAPANDFRGTPLVKRVIAVEGQTLDINFECGHVFVDGILQCEPYINEATYFSAQFQGPVTVKEGHVFVMGDNRNHSSDSRDSRIREVDTRRILGKVLFIAIPGGDEYSPRDWSRFGMVGINRNCPADADCVCFTKHNTPLSDCNCTNVPSRFSNSGP